MRAWVYTYRAFMVEGRDGSYLQDTRKLHCSTKKQKRHFQEKWEVCLQVQSSP